MYEGVFPSTIHFTKKMIMVTMLVMLMVMILVKMLSQVFRLAGKILSPRWQTVSKSSKLFCVVPFTCDISIKSKSVHYVWMQLTPHNIGFPSWGLLYLEFPSPVDTLASDHQIVVSIVFIFPIVIINFGQSTPTDLISPKRTSKVFNNPGSFTIGEQ